MSTRYPLDTALCPLGTALNVHNRDTALGMDTRYFRRGLDTALNVDSRDSDLGVDTRYSFRCG